jgi:hypothetical protein
MGVQAVIAHELGHLKCDHGVWLTVGNVLASGTLTLLPLLTSTIEDALIRWLRAAELTCDRAALLVAQDPRIIISVLMKLAGGCARDLPTRLFLSHLRSAETEVGNLPRCPHETCRRVHPRPFPPVSFSLICAVLKLKLETFLSALVTVLEGVPTPSSALVWASCLPRSPACQCLPSGHDCQ